MECIVHIKKKHCFMKHAYGKQGVTSSVKAQRGRSAGVLVRMMATPELRSLPGILERDVQQCDPTSTLTNFLNPCIKPGAGASQ